jgi:glycosyltransferase involved in cell wall biosynthesis
VANYLFSVVVCTFNREKLLPKCLDSLCNQTISHTQYEIIVVDNASTDNTPSIVADFKSKFPNHSINRILEGKQGLGYARNTGWKQATGRFVAYIDDDAIAGVEWLQQASEIIMSLQPTPICVGGPIGVYFTTPQPEWFKEQYEIRTMGDEPRFLAAGESFSGSNMIWDKSYLVRFNGFDVNKGVTGEYISVGEETALFRRVWSDIPGANFFYSPRLKIQHFVAPVKLTLRYRWKRAFIIGSVIGYEAIKTHKMTRFTRFKISILELWRLTKLVLKSARHITKYSHWQSWGIEHGDPIFIKTGYIGAMFGFKLKLKRG